MCVHAYICECVCVFKDQKLMCLQMYELKDVQEDVLAKLPRGRGRGKGIWMKADEAERSEWSWKEEDFS